MPRIRRPFKVLALLGFLLYLGNALQAWVWVYRLPELRTTRSVQPVTRTAILVAGKGNDEVEDATCRRDLAYAAHVLEADGGTEIEILVPGGLGYSADELVQRIEAVSSGELLIYLSGHGGGTNFGAGGGLNLHRDRLAQALSGSRFESAVVVVDCCWSGEFAESFEEARFPGPVTLITSTDAKHMSPFPTSFLSPSSYGRVLFSYWDQGPQSAFLAANASRKKWRAFYGEKVGVEGQMWEHVQEK